MKTRLLHPLSKWTVLLFVSLSLCFSCKMDAPQEAEPPHEVVLIFHQPKVQKNRKNGSGPFVLGECKLMYLDDNYIQREFRPDTSALYDTVLIQTDQNQLEVAHQYRVLDELSYMFQRGDTALFTYENGKPHVEVLNREEATASLNYDLLWREQLPPGRNYPSVRRNPIAVWIKRRKEGKFGEWDKELMRQIDEELEQGAKEELQQELVFLDSLLAQEKITETAYLHRKLRPIFQLKRQELSKTLKAFSRFQTNKDIEPSHLSIYEQKDGVEALLMENVLDERYDSLLFSKSYRDMINSYYHFWGRKVKRITTRQDHNGQPGFLMNRPDFLARYDSIEADPLFNPKVKKMFLLWDLEEIIKNRSLSEKEEFLRKFEGSYGDSITMKYLQETYTLNLKDKNASKSDMELVSHEGKTLLYQDLLQEHQGKVIYVDFWASTCRPCIMEMPDTEKLKASWKDEDVVFLHLSLDPRQARWQKACEKYKLLEGSYFIQNKYTSAEFEALQVVGIPHYMIYDRTGKLVVPYAPRPSEAPLQDLLRTYL